MRSPCLYPDEDKLPSLSFTEVRISYKKGDYISHSVVVFYNRIYFC